MQCRCARVIFLHLVPLCPQFPWDQQYLHVPLWKHFLLPLPLLFPFPPPFPPLVFMKVSKLRMMSVRADIWLNTEEFFWVEFSISAIYLCKAFSAACSAVMPLPWDSSSAFSVANLSYTSLARVISLDFLWKPRSSTFCWD